MSAWRLKGIGRREAYKKFIHGLDTRGQEVDIVEYYQRGKMMGVVLTKRMEYDM
jgi:hypothetical protein